MKPTLTTHATHPRRQWLVAAARWLALAGLAGLSAVLLGRRQAGADRADCLRVVPCGQCDQNSRCALPPALTWRETRERST